MLAHQRLTISGPREGITNLIARLKEMKSPFFFLPKLSKEYAENIYIEENDALCLKTNRKTLQESKIWLVRRNNSLEVANITSDRNLSCSEYNTILNVFARQLEEGMLPKQCILALTDEQESLENILSQRSYEKLKRWIESCNIDYPLVHDLDLKMWVEFVDSVYVNDRNLNLEFFKTGLSEMAPALSQSNLDDLESKLRYSLEFLEVYNENR